MAKLTDQAIIEHYQQRKQALTQELQKVEDILTALSGGSLAAPQKRKYTRRTVTEKTAASTSTKSPRAAKATRAPKAAAKPSRPAISLDSKINTALEQLGPATKATIVQTLAENDPGTTPQKISKALTLRLAVLEKNGKLKKDSATNEYCIA